VLNCRFEAIEFPTNSLSRLAVAATVLTSLVWDYQQSQHPVVAFVGVVLLFVAVYPTISSFRSVTTLIIPQTETDSSIMPASASPSPEEHTSPLTPEPVLFEPSSLFPVRNSIAVTPPSAQERGDIILLQTDSGSEAKRLADRLLSLLSCWYPQALSEGWICHVAHHGSIHPPIPWEMLPIIVQSQLQADDSTIVILHAKNAGALPRDAAFWDRFLLWCRGDDLATLLRNIYKLPFSIELSSHAPTGLYHQTFAPYAEACGAAFNCDAITGELRWTESWSILAGMPLTDSERRIVGLLQSTNYYQDMLRHPDPWSRLDLLFSNCVHVHSSKSPPNPSQTAEFSLSQDQWQLPLSRELFPDSESPILHHSTTVATTGDAPVQWRRDVPDGALSTEEDEGSDEEEEARRQADVSLQIDYVMVATIAAVMPPSSPGIVMQRCEDPQTPVTTSPSGGSSPSTTYEIRSPDDLQIGQKYLSHNGNIISRIDHAILIQQPDSGRERQFPLSH